MGGDEREIKSARAGSNKEISEHLSIILEPVDTRCAMVNGDWSHHPFATPLSYF